MALPVVFDVTSDSNVFWIAVYGNQSYWRIVSQSAIAEEVRDTFWI